MRMLLLGLLSPLRGFVILSHVTHGLRRGLMFYRRLRRLRAFYLLPTAYCHLPTPLHSTFPFSLTSRGASGASVTSTGARQTSVLTRQVPVLSSRQ